ncbi:YqaA family protein, partial [Pseudomonas aeruginosa]|uniref:YqaA family protein n=1 Tax=Pseudomonas aeruginosa TaxID=287 RepID=UPI0039682D74
MLTDWAAYAGLFLSAFGSATLLPLQSETVLAALLLRGGQSVAWLLALAIVGNVLGSWVNWWLGRYLEHFRGRRWFPVGEVQLLRAQRHYRRYGRWTLLLSWVPVIGDPLGLRYG